MMFFKKLLQIILIFSVLLITYIALSFIALFLPKHQQCTEQTKSIYIYHTFAHTEIMIPVGYFKEEFFAHFPTLLQNSVQGYIAFSYGDRDFMMQTPLWDDTDPYLAAKSLLINTPALLRVGHYYGINKKESVKIGLSQACLSTLKESILKSFATHNNKFIKYSDSYKDPKVFYYEANKPYNLFHTCNSWTGDKLREAGIKMPYITPFSQQVVYHYLK